ncbi:hypothetical protein BN11_3990006 [Nostocoides australiense Ben110]|uniref:DNA2/NAM7 helicase helicase domain-containing protein n=1 Tax=Nostocoides australiense Ben110 TaxID=1193182 RepID=W6JZD6_9MICO|nr:hypothetical protein BN11_3990006 [Tetrasphaera australiensis Ben110]
MTGRLVHCGLGSLVREPGTGSAPAAHRPSQFARASQVQSAWTSAGRELSEHVARMHRGREPWSLSVDEIQERIAAVCEAPEPPRSKIRLSGPHLGALGPAEAERWMTTLRGVAERGAWPSGEEPADPWWGAAIRTDEDAERARLAAKALGASGLAQFDAVFTEVFAGVSVPPLRTLGQHGAFIAEMARIGQVLEVFRLGVFDAPLEEWTAHTSGGTFERWRHGRAVKALLRPGAPHHDVDPLLHSALQARPVWQQVRGSQIMPGQVAGLGRAREAHDKLAAHASYLGERLRGHPDLLAERLPQLAARAADLSAQRSRLEVLPAVTDDLDAARTAGLGELIEDLAARRLSPEHVAAETEFVWLASVLAQTTASDSGYARVTGDAVRAAVTRFRENDRALQRAAAAGIIAERGEGKPLICVCSPHTVGLYLSRKAHFDVVIIDDAQALATADGISALARADQAVVVGDSHLPGPTFFTAAGAPLCVALPQPGPAPDRVAGRRGIPRTADLSLALRHRGGPGRGRSGHRARPRPRRAGGARRRDARASAGEGVAGRPDRRSRTRATHSGRDPRNDRPECRRLPRRARRRSPGRPRRRPRHRCDCSPRH